MKYVRKCLKWYPNWLEWSVENWIPLVLQCVRLFWCRPALLLHIYSQNRSCQWWNVTLFIFTCFCIVTHIWQSSTCLVPTLLQLYSVRQFIPKQKSYICLCTFGVSVEKSRKFRLMCMWKHQTCSELLPVLPKGQLMYGTMSCSCVD